MSADYEVRASDMHMFKTTPLVRRTDVDTSKAAAEKCQTFKAKHIAIIWTCLKDNGPMIPGEIARRMNLDYHAVQRRIKECIDKGLIERLPETRHGQHVLKAKG